MKATDLLKQYEIGTIEAVDLITMGAENETHDVLTTGAHHILR